MALIFLEMAAASMSGAVRTPMEKQWNLNS
jgi:hypothetical protein